MAVKITELPQAQTSQDSDIIPIVQNNETKQVLKSTLLQDIISNIANTYSNTTTYSTGDYVIYDEVLYQANTDISIAEEWNSTHWTAINITSILKNMENAIYTNAIYIGGELAIWSDDYQN